MTDEIAVAATDLSKTYLRRDIFRGLTLKVRRGQFVVLLGKNGAGKSTLLRLIAGLEPADRGTLNVFGTDVDRDDLARRRRIALVSESIAVAGHLSLDHFVSVYRPLQPAWDEGIFTYFMRTFGLSVAKRFGTLSRGQRIQFFFALAAAGKPALYLLDEVTSVLDANARFAVMTHLRAEVATGATVLLATNIAAETHNFATEILFLVDGKIGLDCSVDDLQVRFTKFRIPIDGSTTPTLPKGARPVQLNRDGSVSYLMPIGPGPRALVTGLDDLRGVTTEDVFIYFTGPENDQ